LQPIFFNVLPSKGVDGKMLVDVLKTLAHSITDPIAKRQGPVTTKDVGELWRELLRRTQWIKVSGFTEITV